VDTPAKLDFVRKYLQALSGRDLETIKTFFDDESTFEDPYGVRSLQGVAKIAAFYQKVFAYDWFAEQTGEACACGDSIAVPYRAKVGSNLVNCITVFQFADSGKLKSMRAYWGPENMTPI
jgi:steroid delta-isomerase